MENFFQIDLFTREECARILKMPRIHTDRATIGIPFEPNWINGKKGKAVYEPVIQPESWVEERIRTLVDIQTYATVTGIWPLIYKEYWVDGHIGYHTDGARGVKRIGVSISLNDEYTGGRLQFADWRYGNYDKDDIRNVEINTPPGSATIFPIFIPHRVTPVTSGTRKQLVTWLTGEKLNW